MRMSVTSVEFFWGTSWLACLCVTGVGDFHLVGDGSEEEDMEKEKEGAGDGG